MTNNSKTFSSILIGAVLIALLLWLGVYAYNNIVVSAGVPLASSPAAPAVINSFSVQRPNFVVNGSGLGKVEIWAVPEEPGVTEADSELLGDAALQSDPSAEAQTWALSIPASPVLAEEIFAKGYDTNGNFAVELSLPYAGATELYDAIWGPAPEGLDMGSGTASGNDTPTPPLTILPAPKDSSSTETTTDAQQTFFFTLGVGEKGSVGALTIKLLQITNDSRCPQTAVCVWAGQVQAEVQLTSGTKTADAQLSSAGNPYAFAKYNIDIAGVSPQRQSGAVPPQSAYQVEFAIQAQ